jgi:hypothetical protein
MSTTTDCSTALKTGDGLFQRLHARLLRSNQQEGQTLSFVERASPRASYAPRAYHGKSASRADSVGFRFHGDVNFVSASNDDQLATEAMGRTA